MKVIDILNSVEPLKALSSAELKINTAVKIVKALDEINKVLSVFEERRKPYMPKDNNEKISEENIQKINEILTQDVDVEISKIPLSELEDVKIKAADLMLINWIIDYDAEVQQDV